MPDDVPLAPRSPVVDEVFGHLVADPYRWLEDPGSPATKAWSDDQDRRWGAWAEGAAARRPLRERLAALVPGYTGPPHVVGRRRFWMAREVGQDHAVLHVADDAGQRVLVDPNAMADDATTTLDGWAPSLEGDRLAYLLSSGGDEEASLWILDVATGQVVEGPVDRVRYSPLAWLSGGEELCYVRRRHPALVPSGEEQYHRRVLVHAVGDDPGQDVELFGEGSDPTAYFGLEASPDGRWLAVTTALGTAPRNDVHLLERPGRGADPQWTAVVEGRDGQSLPHLDQQGRLWLLTDLDAPRRRLVNLDPASIGGEEGWTEVVGEDPDGAVLEDFVLSGRRLVVLWSRHALSEITIHDRASGERLGAVALPGAGSASLTGRPDEHGEVWVGYTDHTTPFVTMRLDPVSGALTAGEPVVVGPARAPRDAGIHSRQLVATSADGTQVRLTVVSRDGPRGPRPTVLYGYGGFDVALTPAYSSATLAWVEAGGVWVVAHLRGGSEEGEAWHRDGMRENKHHVFEDFEAVADLLVDIGMTTPGRLGILGGSNGGLLVGAALTRSPGRYGAAVCSAPLLDMVRYERSGLGPTWTDEFGTASDPVELGWLLAMSPYHHVSDGVAYPATLFTVFDGDSRVDPSHARKMAAALQWATSADPLVQPVLLRREADVGHGARSLGRTVELAADQLAFLGHHLGLELADGI